MFPPEFPFSRVASEPRPVVDSVPYVVGAMMTPSHAHFGRRLAASCRSHSLPLALFELPMVHRSISRNGSDDLRYTKANFVRFLLERYRRPILYVDVDCVIAQRPARIDDLFAEQVDFAIFNWLAEEHTEAYIPAEIAVREPDARANRGRFYRFSHSIDVFSRTQLLCSGAVQWYNITSAAGALLEAWQGVIERSPGSADDKCLDFAFNNWPSRSAPIKAAWLGKAYARYAWWIYERPVIDHPEFPHPGRGFVPLDELDGKRRIYRESLLRQNVTYIFPKECLVDARARALFRLQDGNWRAAGIISTPLWLSGDSDE